MNCVPVSLRLLLIVLASGIGASSLAAAKKPEPAESRTQEELEAATRLQVFLDRANFSPGKLDGHYGDFTRKALALYRQSRGEPAQLSPATGENSATPPDVTGIDLASVGPALITYTVTDLDVQNVGAIPDKVRAQAKLKALPYRDAGEALAEKFHCDRAFLEQLNSGKTKIIKPGDQLAVPNVEPFEVATVKDLRPGSEITLPVANEIPDEAEAPTPKPDPGQASGTENVATVVDVDTKTNFLTVLEDTKLIAAYPVTIGSAQTKSPIGEYKVRGVAKLPKFRYDEEMLKHGERSSDFQMLPPGPNSPVGVIWIALDKKGIGLHGTRDPDSIGRSASHGCVRLANWDIVRLVARVKAGASVSIH